MGDPQTTVESPAHAGTANLRPFRPGPDPRRANSSNAGASLIEHYNRLAHRSLSLEELDRIGNDDSEPLVKRQAAKSLHRSLGDDFAKNGAPLAANDLDRILDRTVGRPKQHVEVVTEEVRDPAAMTVELLTLLAEHPELREALGGLVSAEALALPEGGAPIEDGAGGAGGCRDGVYYFENGG